MIKNVFIPEHIGNNYLFPKRIVGIDIGKTHVNATQVYLKGTSITLEKFVETPLEVSTGNNYQDRAANAIALTLEQVDRSAELRSALPSSVVIFKELKLPFIGHDKIALVVEFELEPMLPFPIQDAVIDFIVTRENLPEQSSEILVAAVQKTHLIQHLQLFEKAGINPKNVTVDFFAVYGLLNQLPSYSSLSGTTALIDVGSQSTRIAFIHNGQLRLIRSLNKGVINLAKSISEATHIGIGQAMEELMRYGLERYDTPAYTHSLTTSLTHLWNEIAFTLNSLSMQADKIQTVDRIILFGGGAEIKGLSQFVTSTIGIPCEKLAVQELMHNPHIVMAHKNGVPASSILSLSIALPSPITQNFNLLKKEFDLVGEQHIFNKQLIAAGALLLLLFISFLGYSFFQTRKLRNEMQQSQQEVLSELSDRFPRTLADATDVEEAVESAKQEARKEEQFWFAFANPNRIPFLAYLLELTSRIDQKSLGFVIEKLVITENVMIISGSVRDHEALYLLEKSLGESKLFSDVEKQQNPQFTNMRIKLAKPV